FVHTCGTDASHPKWHRTLFGNSCNGPQREADNDSRHGAAGLNGLVLVRRLSGIKKGKEHEAFPDQISTPGRGKGELASGDRALHRGARCRSCLEREDLLSLHERQGWRGLLPPRRGRR